MRQRMFSLLFVAVGLCGMLGCERSLPSASDPALGRDTLLNALSAWKQGESVDAYKQATPAVTVVDKYWKQGVKLLDYELAGDGKPDGYDVQFKATLTTQEAKGKPTKKTAIFNVSTTPKLVVVRLEPNG